MKGLTNNFVQVPDYKFKYVKPFQFIFSVVEKMKPFQTKDIRRSLTRAHSSGYSCICITTISSKIMTIQ